MFVSFSLDISKKKKNRAEKLADFKKTDFLFRNFEGLL